nr:clp protease proteolytic subunit [Dapsilanthus disjunctus]
MYTRFSRERGLFLGDKIEAPLANHLIGLMIYFNLEDEKNDESKDIFLYINSPGGSTLPGMAIYDTMLLVIPDVNTVCIGLAASMASLILAGGEFSKRLAFPHARVMIHQPECAFIQGRVHDLALEVLEVTKLRSNIAKAYADRTGNPYWAVSEDLEKDIFMSATEAKDYGIIDKIGVGVDEEKSLWSLLIDDFFDWKENEKEECLKECYEKMNFDELFKDDFDLWDSKPKYKNSPW